MTYLIILGKNNFTGNEKSLIFLYMANKLFQHYLLIIILPSFMQRWVQ